MSTPIHSWARDRLGYAFQRPELLELALTHPSAAYEAAPGTESNQRLEFLGDSVLGFIAADLVYKEFPSWAEGRLTKVKNTIVSTPVLARLAQALGFSGQLRLGRGEARMGGADRDSNLADAFEAVVGALYLDGGIEVARHFVTGQLRPEMNLAATGRSTRNYKAELLELAQSRHWGTPVYRVTRSEGPDHQPEFWVAVELAGQPVAQGNGRSKKEAEQAAARIALGDLEAAPQPGSLP